MSLMADKSPAAAPTTPQQVPQAWHYNMNMYNMNMYQAPYMYNPAAYGAHNYYQYYGQRMPNWGNYQGYPPGTQLRPWGIPPQPQAQQQMPPGLEQQPQLPAEQPQQQQQQSAEDTMALAANNTNNQSEPSTELPPLPPGPPPGTPAPPGTQAPPLRPPFHQFTPPPNITTNSTPTGGTTGVSAGVGGVGSSGGVGPIRFNMNAQRPRPQLSQANPLGPRPGQQTTSSKRKNKKKKKQQQQLQQQQQQLQQQLQQQMAEDDDEPETPPLPASPPPPPPPPPPPACPPPPPQQPSLPNSVGVTLMSQHPPGIRYVDDWPPSLRDYVNRCYAKCVLQVDMDRVGVILKGKILRATSDGTLWTKNWAEEPLPLLDSDSKPAGGLTLGMNLKDKLNKMSSRLGPPQKNQDQQQQMGNQEVNINRPHKRSSYRPSFKRSYSSDSSSSSSSDSDDNGSSSNKRSSRDKRSSQSWSNKRHSSKKSEKAHLYKEYGSIGGGVGGPIRKEVLDKRAARFSCDNANRNKNGLNTSSSSPPLYVIDSKPNSQYMIPNVASVVNSANGTAGSNNGAHDWEEDLHIVGTSTDIEKQYLRLTSAPDASQVRPPQILAKALSLVKEKWAKESDYHYTCEQLKSIRQDLTVQGIRDEFTIEVYETHARIALEKGDHAEFNQCQSQLCQLHTPSSKNRGEFVAYRILYYIFTNEFLDLSTLVNSLREEDKADDCISHGLKMAKAWTSGIHSRLFKLYLTAPRMSPYLIDWFLARERLKALKVIIKAYRPAVPVDLLMKELAFGSIGDTLEFVDKFGLIFTDSSRTMVDCKSSTPILAAV